MRGITWILVTDVSRARLFEHRPDGERRLVPIFEDDQPELRDREERRANDRPGRSQDGSEPIRHAMDPRTSNADRIREQYAREVLDRLRAEAAEREFDKLVIVAPPPMLGTLRPLLEHNLRERLVGELGKDLAWMSEHELPSHLEEYLGKAKSSR